MQLIKFLTKHVIVRYIISGGTSAVTDLVLLYILNSIVGIHYLLSAVIAFIVSFCVSFFLQKFWTFKSHEEKTHKQIVVYLGTSLVALGVNTLLMYLFVDQFGLPVITSQIIAGGLVAVCTFFVSRNFVFKYKEQNNT